MTLAASIPVVWVTDYERARGFWRDVLGFRVVGEVGEPVTVFGIFARDHVQVFLSAWDSVLNGVEVPRTHWRACFPTDDLQDVAVRLRSAGHAFTGPVGTELGATEIEIVDPDGNVLCFRQDAT